VDLGSHIVLPLPLPWFPPVVTTLLTFSTFLSHSSTYTHLLCITWTGSRPHYTPSTRAGLDYKQPHRFYHLQLPFLHTHGSSIPFFYRQHISWTQVVHTHLWLPLVPLVWLHFSVLPLPTHTLMVLQFPTFLHHKVLLLVHTPHWIPWFTAFPLSHSSLVPWVPFLGSAPLVLDWFLPVGLPLG